MLQVHNEILRIAAMQKPHMFPVGRIGDRMCLDRREPGLCIGIVGANYGASRRADGKGVRE
ncbi:MAG: hypothetical protein OXF07_13385 [Rhodobacter sp.]|nr:hypothetical protein [Rhodobacter sp.]MCY4167758.1 hypothetical protein [Rhodobacter sp.]